MNVEKIGDKLAIVIPHDVAETLGLHEGDSVEVRRSVAPSPIPCRSDGRHARAFAPPAAGYKFDREEANAR